MVIERLAHREIADICTKLSLLLHAGGDTGSAMALLAEGEADKNRRRLLEGITADMDEGSTIAAAMEKTKAFPDYVCRLVRVGEETGKTEEALKALAEYYEQRARLDMHLRSALLYPAVLMLIMLAVVVVLLTKVLPVFNDVYASLGGSLTGVAGGLLSVGMALDGAMPLLCVLLGVAVVFLAAFAGVPGFREAVLKAWQKVWGDRGISRKLSTARFAQALAMGISSGLDTADALELADTLLGDSPSVKKRLDACREKMDSGVSLARAMGETELLPMAESRLLELGMRSGAEDSVMTQIARRLSEESDAALERKIGQIEPTLVIVASVLVGLILLSVMLPLMNIMAAIG